MGFPQLRFAHFRDALIAGDHEVRPVHEGDPELRQKTRGADAVVSAGPFGPGRAALEVVGDLPFWADIPGDPLAELQTVLLAAARGDAEAGVGVEQRRSAALATAWSVISRADGFSVISAPQRYALLGQLGLAGRLGEDHAERAVSVLPVAWGGDARPPQVRAPGAPLRLALAGGFNTWFDEQTLISGLEKVFAKTEDIDVICVGGGLPGHHSAGYARFEAWARGPGSRGRVSLHPWVPVAELEQKIGTAHLGLCLDRASAEPELGSRTRLLFFARMGLGVIGTTGSALASEAAADGWLLAVPSEDPDAFVEVVLGAHARGSAEEALTEAQQRLARRYDPVQIAAPLIAWAASPTRLAPGRPPEVVLAEEIRVLKAELARVYASPTWQALNQVRQVLWRR